MAQNNPISREDGLFTEAAEFTSYSKASFNCPIQDEHSQPSSQQSSAVSSRSNSGDSLWPGQSSQSSDDFSVIHSLDFITPDSTFSESDGSFHGFSSSSLDPVLLEADCDVISRSRASGIPQARCRPRLQVETSFQCTDGEFGDICYSPVDSDPRSEFDYLPTDIALPRDHNGTLRRAELQISSPSHLYAAGIDQTIPHCLNHPEAGQASVFGPSVPPFGYGCSEQRPSPLCSCHKLLKRPFFPLPEPDSIFRACDSYSRQIRQTSQTILERLQLKFEVMWKNIHDTIRTLPAHMQHILYQTFDTPPTLQNAFETLKLLCEKRPPTPQGYLSLAFFARAWLSLEEKHDVSEVTNALFAETTHCITLIPSQDIREAHGLQSRGNAYDALLQLLWRPRVLTTTSLESHGLFCPIPTLSTIYSANDSFRTKTASHVGPKWVLSRLCRGMVDVLIYLSPADIFSETTNALPPLVRNHVAQNKIKKLTWLIDVINQSGNGVLVTVTECSQCGRPFTGQDGPKNRKRHLKRNCELTKSRSDYRHVRCPYLDCGQIFTRSDNLHPHIQRKHSA